MFLLLSLLLFSTTPDLTINTLIQFEPVPEEAGFMVYPYLAHIDEKGRYYLLDEEARTVFIWNADGSFFRTLGGPGEGPGEFTFKNTRRTARQGFMGLTPSHIMVYDGLKRKMHYFDRDFKYLESKHFKGPGNRTRHMGITGDGHILIHEDSNGNEPMNVIALYDEHFKPITTVASYPDKTYTIKRNEEGKMIKATFHAFDSEVLSYADASSNEIVIADANKPELKIVDSNGRHLRTIPFEIRRAKVTEADKNDYRDMAHFRKRPNFYAFDFPEYRPYFNEMQRYGEGYLIYTRNHVERRVQGIYINEKGKTIGRFNIVCGDSGNIFASRGRLIAIFAGEEDDFEISEVELQ